MDNTKIFIAVIIVVVVVLGAFFFFGGGFSTTALDENISLPTDDEAVRDVASVQVSSSDALGEYLTDSFGMTLYVTTKEECSGDCLNVWPPYLADGLAEDGIALGVDLREDTGAYQYTWNGEALYYYSGDSVPGEANGDGIDAVWSLPNISKR